MAIVHAQTTNFNVGAGSTSQSFSVTPSVGSFIAFIGGCDGGTGFTSVTDNQASGGNTYTQAVTRSGFNATSAIWYSPNIQKASGTFTITISGGSTRVWGAIVEVTGLTSNSPVVKTASSNGGSNPFSVGPTATTGENNALVLACCAFYTLHGSTTVESVTPAWTELYDFGNFRGEGDLRIVSTTGGQSCSWTSGSVAGSENVIAAFSDPITYTPPRITQVVQSAVIHDDTVVKRMTQAVQSLVVQGASKKRLTQVVQTIVVINPVPDTPPPILVPTNSSLWKLLRFDMKRRDEEEA